MRFAFLIFFSSGSSNFTSCFALFFVDEIDTSPFVPFFSAFSHSLSVPSILYSFESIA